jgi:hypothetical protein
VGLDPRRSCEASRNRVRKSSANAIDTHYEWHRIRLLMESSMGPFADPWRELKMAAKPKSESTSSKAAAAAAKVLKDPKASKDAKTAAASTLTQSKSKEVTSPKAASAAAKVLKDPKASKEAKTAAASALTQRPGKK